MATRASVSDGRTKRSQRTRDAVVDATIALVQAGNLRPTAREIADHAGVSLRSVYVHFSDLEDLFLAAATRQMLVVIELFREIPAEGPLVERAAALCSQRSRIYQETGLVRRAAELNEPFSPTIAQLLGDLRTIGRDELSRVFATELARLEPDAATRRLAALDASTSAAAWDHLVVHHRLGADAAAITMTEACHALLSA